MNYISFSALLTAIVLIFLLSDCQPKSEEKNPIDRHALVTRHNVNLRHVDTLGSLSVGNGEFAFTVDVSGLQTFYKAYENGIPLGTQTQWAWHSIPDKDRYTLKDVWQEYESCDGSAAPYPIQHKEGRAAAATNSLRANPHRLHLGLIGLTLLKENGDEVQLNDLKNIKQELDLWTGKIESYYEIEGIPVRVILYAHQQEDKIAARIESELILKNRLKMRLNFPYGKDCHVCPGYDFDQPDKHLSILSNTTANTAIIKRQLDSTQYYTNVSWTKGSLQSTTAHHFELTPSSEETAFEFTVQFTPTEQRSSDDFTVTQKNSIDHWKTFWTSGGALDFSNCTDPRAFELERRVVLSQYLTKIQCTGSLPPQETGLTMNSWYGKFHLEMHWWHAAHFAFWGRPELFQESLNWYETVMPQAKNTAQQQGYTGARWQKMTDPYGAESPSSIGAFIIWQQPHPIYLAELLYRNDSSKEVLHKYKDIVFSTADFMASFVKQKNGKYHLCHPLIPAQEIFHASETDNPTFELQYWEYGLTVAQQWRTRLGLPEDSTWAKVRSDLAPLPVASTLYLPNSTTPDAYTDDQYRRDHPAVLGAYGFLPLTSRIDTLIMKNTYENIATNWQWETTWGWDYPLMALSAARLNKPDAAIDALLMDVQKNTYLVNGHNYQDTRLRLYLPGNGGLLAAVAMMAAGWDGSSKANPGFPNNGKWNVRWEGLTKIP